MKPSLITKLRSSIARLIAPPSAGAPRGGYRMYASAKASRLREGFGSSGNSSADAEIQASLRAMRAKSREVIRDAGYAKRAKTVVVSNVIGSGIGMQAQVKTSRGDLSRRTNTDIEEGFESWSEVGNCHTGGRLHFSAMEQFLMGQVFEAGEVFVRKHYRKFGNSDVPFALEPIEAERVVDELQPAPLDPSARVRMGVELDAFHRPLAYWIRTLHPGDTRFAAGDIDRIERVPADQIIHLGIIDRWPQTRCVPWLHTAIGKVYDMDGYTEAEIVRARNDANRIGALKTPREYGAEMKDESGKLIAREITSEAGSYEILYEDEEMQFPNPGSPNPSADPFLRFLLREIAAGTGVSYESLSRDYSQSNYSSSRLSLLDDRDLWRIFQMWFLRAFRLPVHRNWLQQAVLSRALVTIPVEQYALDPRKFEKVRFKPRGWSWVDPAKEVDAYKEAIKAGLITRTDVIAQTANGRDREDIDEERKQELDESKALGLKFDTDPEFLKSGQDKPGRPVEEGKEDDEGGKKNANSNGKEY